MSFRLARLLLLNGTSIVQVWDRGVDRADGKWLCAVEGRSKSAIVTKLEARGRRGFRGDGAGMGADERGEGRITRGAVSRVASAEGNARGTSWG